MNNLLTYWNQKVLLLHAELLQNIVSNSGCLSVDYAKSYKMPKILNIFAWIISILFHPIGMVLASCCIVYFSLTIYIRDILPTNDCIKTLLPIFLLYYVLPLVLCGLYIFFLKWRHSEPDISRLTLLGMVIAIYTINSFNSAVDQIFMPYILASTFTIIVATIITYFWMK